MSEPHSSRGADPSRSRLSAAVLTGNRAFPTRDRRGAVTLFRRRMPRIQRRELQHFADRLQEDVADGRPFECLITNDRELRKLNCEFLGKDYATDVLSFPSSNGLLGSLAISAQRAAAQAKEYGHSIEQEIEILMLHGLLHLVGMDHETDRGKMARAEAAWRRRFELPHGLIERARR